MIDKITKDVTKKLLSIILVLAMVITICPQVQLITVSGEDTSPYCISEGRPAYASSEKDGNTIDKALDGDMASKYESVWDEEKSWFYVDLGEGATIDHIKVNWEAAHAKSYKIQISNDEENWTDVYTKGNVPDTDNPQVTEEATTLGATDIGINYTLEYGQKDTDGKSITLMHANWTDVKAKTGQDVRYRVLIDGKVAKANDPYTFNAHPDANGNISLPEGEGEYTMTVIANAKDGSNQYNVEVGRGTKQIIVPKQGETTSAAETESIETTTPVNELEQTIDFSHFDAYKKTARYVRVYMAEKSMQAYGYSCYEFQVYGTSNKVDRPVDYGTNIAKDKTTDRSGIQDVWWMKDENGNVKPEEAAKVESKNAVDGSLNTSFVSKQEDKQWLSVDLGKTYDIGRIIVNWTGDAGKVYDYQVSNDGKEWTTIYRNKRGYAKLIDNQQVYAKARYVRIYGYTRVESGNGFGISELEVYEYKEGDDKPTHVIEDFDQEEVVKAKTGAGSYLSNSMYNEKTKLPIYADESYNAPISSNDWWQSSLINQYGNLMSTLPLKSKFSSTGLQLLTATKGWIPKDVDMTKDVNFSNISETKTDLTIKPENFDAQTGYDSVVSNGDYSVNMNLCDKKEGKQMSATFVKGSPYIFMNFQKNTVAYLSSSSITRIFDDNNKTILNTSDILTTDHFGVEVEDNDHREGRVSSKSYYCITLPEGTKVQLKGKNIKITFPSVAENYMSVGAMNASEDLNKYYQHGYAFVTDTQVTYKYNDDESTVTTTYTATTELKRSGFENTTMQCMLPHQSKYTDAAKTPVTTYTSVRGDLKSIFANDFTTTQTFAGLLPTYATPTDDFKSEQCKGYLEALKEATANINPAADAYWEGKNVHPLAMGVLMADQLGESELKEVFLQRLRNRLVDWFTYSGPDDISYLIYNQKWGTIYYKDSEFGANAAICDHHFTYGYFAFGAAVLATYDNDFYNNYKDMVDLLIRDYANPKNGGDDQFCEFRAFDQYEGHSWAGGYADNDSGNNQESASESLFSWVAMYLWGVRTGEDTYRDAGAYGFTIEMEAIEQYWFDYDKTNWIREGESAWPYNVVAQVYGGSNFFGTFFGGQPLYCYGIQWLPISDYLTYYGMNQERCAEIYKALEDDTEAARQKAGPAAYDYVIDNYVKELKVENDKLPEDQRKTDEELRKTAIEIKGDEATAASDKAIEGYTTPDNGWQHITWPFLSQTAPSRAMDKFKANATKLQKTDQATTYWFILSMETLGHKTADVLVSGGVSGSAYYNETTKKYTVQCWNPTDAKKTATVKKNGIVLGTVTVAAKGFVNFTVDESKIFDYQQLNAPKFKSTPATGGETEENVSGSKKYDDTQLVEISAEEGADIYYTTDGTIPTNKSTKYTGGKILVSSTETIKAVAVKDNYIDSAYGTVTMNISGDVIQSSDDLAYKKIATASSENNNDLAKNVVDGLNDTRWQGDMSKLDPNDWIQVDLGEVKAVNTVVINWENAYAKKYKIQVSEDGNSWKDVATQYGTPGEVTTTFKVANARYVRMQGCELGMDTASYSLFTFKVYGANQAVAPVITPTTTGDTVYDNAQQVTLVTTVKGAEIKYTLDGTDPTENSPSYVEPFTVDKSTVVKAVTYRKGMLLSDVAQSTIMINNTITMNDEDITVAVKNNKKLTALTPNKVTWSSSDENIATVDENGQVTGVKEGEAIVTASIDGGSVTCKVTVVSPIKLTSISIDPQTVEMEINTSKTLKVVFDPADTTDDTTVKWTSSDESIVTVNDSGAITAKDIGKAVITAECNGLTSECNVTVNDIPLETKIKSTDFNLALGKKVTVSSIYSGEGSKDTSVLVDGILTGDKVVTDWDKSRTSESVTVDLGTNYATSGVNQIAMKFVNDATFANNMEVQYSSNGIDYVSVGKTPDLKYTEDNKGLFTIDIDAASNIDDVRYVRVVMPGHKGWGFQMNEVAVISKKANAEKVTVETLGNTKSFTASSNRINEITYTIEAGENQSGCQYLIYVDGEQKETQSAAGTYTITNVAGGNHELTCSAVKDGKYSEPIVQNVTVYDMTHYIDTSRNLALGCDVVVDAINNTNEETNKDPKALTNGIIAENKTVQTMWGEKNATITIDLGKKYSKELIQEVLFVFKDDSKTFSENYTVSFSSDDKDYEQVASVKGRKFTQIVNQSVNTSEYTQGVVRYVKINMTDLAYSWGFQLHEIGVMGTDEFIKPDTYNLSVDDNFIGRVESGYEYTLGDAKYGYICGDKVYPAKSKYIVTADTQCHSLNEDLTMTVVAGASIKKSDPTGLRFGAKISGKNIEYIDGVSDIKTGMLITTKDLYQDNEGKGIELNLAAEYTKINVVNKGWIPGTIGQYAAAIVNIYKDNYSRPFIARAYMTITYADGTKSEPLYSGMTPSRNVKEVAIAVQQHGYPGCSEADKLLIDQFAAEFPE